MTTFNIHSNKYHKNYSNVTTNPSSRAGINTNVIMEDLNLDCYVHFPMIVTITPRTMPIKIICKNYSKTDLYIDVFVSIYS